MAEMTTYDPGVPSWVDLTSSDPAGARDFYGALFSWNVDVGDADSGHYAMCSVRSKPVAGINGMPAQGGMPTVWITYLATDDIDETANRIAGAGGNVFMGPMDVMEAGRMLLAMDSGGAAFGVWEAGQHKGAELVNEPGCLIWNELSTRDLDEAMSFYSDVFGYDWEPLDDGDTGPVYQMFSVGGRTVGGAMHMTDRFPPGVPANWLVYFAVANADETCARAGELGGAVETPPSDASFGRWALLRDPQGGRFAVVQPPEDAPAQ